MLRPVHASFATLVDISRHHINGDKWLSNDPFIVAITLTSYFNTLMAKTCLFSDNYEDCMILWEFHLQNRTNLSINCHSTVMEYSCPYKTVANFLRTRSVTILRFYVSILSRTHIRADKRDVSISSAHQPGNQPFMLCINQDCSKSDTRLRWGDAFCFHIIWR
jgi:hypothetical protein